MTATQRDIAAVQTVALLSHALLDDIESYRAQFSQLQNPTISLHYLVGLVCRLIPDDEHDELGEHLRTQVQAMTAELADM